jgi:hypothetical protein
MQAEALLLLCVGPVSMKLVRIGTVGESSFHGVELSAA